MLMLARIIRKLKINKFGGNFIYMTAQLLQFKTLKTPANSNRPLLSMFMVRRHDKFKVITNLAQLTPQELVSALVRDAVWSEKENAASKKLAEF